jgi:hypothetical protein
VPNTSINEHPLQSKTGFLSLPTEVRVIIYRMLCPPMKVMVRSRQAIYRGPGAIMCVCRTFAIECTPIFYEKTTFVLLQEAYLHVLKVKIRPQNMARVQSLVIGGFKDYWPIGDRFVLEVPSSLKTLCFGWKGAVSDHEIGRMQWTRQQNDKSVREELDRICRPTFNNSVKSLWINNPNLRIFLEAWVGGNSGQIVSTPKIFWPLCHKS